VADQPPDPRLREADEPPDTEAGGLAPWQKLVQVVGLVLLLAVVVALFIGGGHTPPIQHGP
jgi:hypothetical protein